MGFFIYSIMRYLKLFEGHDYEEIDLSEGNILNYMEDNIIGINYSIYNKIKDIFNKYSFQRSINNFDQEYMHIYLKDKVNISLYFLKDDYYFVCSSSNNKWTNYKCDQIRGLMSCIKMLLNK